MSRDYPMQFYNVQVGRDPNRVADEIRGLLDPRPAVLGLCETVGYSLPGVADYICIRDRSTESRANIAAYVKASLDLRDVKWHDLHETWTKTAPGATGQHAPRSILEFRAGRLFVLVAHQCPKGTDNTKPAQQEGVDKLTARMAPWTRDDWGERTDEDKAEAKRQARIVLWDSNRMPGEDGPGPDSLARNIDGKVCGGQIDNAVWRGGSGEVNGVHDVRYADWVGGVEMRSDHHDALLFTFCLVGA